VERSLINGARKRERVREKEKEKARESQTFVAFYPE
tara:strand:- start:74 stop:181 length:108 start_codon:yes stop_codon:yes gene_type:complete